MESTYQLIPVKGKPKLLGSHLELAQEVKAMRNSGRGYYVYEVIEQETGRHLSFLTGWNPKA